MIGLDLGLARPSAVGSAGAADAALDYDFAANRYRRGGRVLAPAAAFSVQRAGAGFAPLSVGRLKPFASHRLRRTRHGALIEPAATNAVTRNTDFAHAAWQRSTTGTGVTPAVTTNFGIAPDGTMTADRVQLDSGALGNAEIQNWNAAVPGGAVVYSVWLRSLGAPVTVSLFAGGAFASVVVTAAWGRHALAVPTPNSSAVRLVKRTEWGSGGAADLLAWGAQLEIGGAPSSEILTAAGAATRPADTVTLHLPAAPLDLETIFADGTRQQISGAAGDFVLPVPLPHATIARIIGRPA